MINRKNDLYFRIYNYNNEKLVIINEKYNYNKGNNNVQKKITKNFKKTDKIYLKNYRLTSLIEIII